MSFGNSFSNINPFEVLPENTRGSLNEIKDDVLSKKSLTHLDEEQKFKRQTTVYVITSEKKKVSRTTTNSPFRSSSAFSKIIKSVKKEYLKPRKKNESCTFDCTDNNDLKQTKNNVLDKYQELKERVKQMKENLKFGIKASDNVSVRGGGLYDQSFYSRSKIKSNINTTRVVSTKTSSKVSTKDNLIDLSETREKIK